MMSTTRREFLRCAATAGASLLPFSAARAKELHSGGAASGVSAFFPSAWPSSWLVDVDGNGTVNPDDRRVIEGSLGAVRGLGLEPNPGYDFRADLLGRGRVSDADLQLFDQLASPGPALPRPLVICWHYGWYHPTRRIQEPTTATYLGGDYLSDDPSVEEGFHALKHEFGISAELLSWTSEPDSAGSHQLVNYERGYFAAPSAPARRFGWLYETTVNLRSTQPMRLAESTGRPAMLEDHFRRMARRMVDPNRGVISDNVLRIDGRPVVYMFASHLLGTDTASFGEVGGALDRARAAFIEQAGVAPYWIGDEALFAVDAGVTEGRRFRAPFFDAITRYHHYEATVVEGLGAQLSEVRLAGAYAARVLETERRTAEAFAGVRNRYTGAPVLVLPSSAAGFAKAGLPTLRASRTEYAEFLRAMLEITDDNFRRAAESVTGAATSRGPASQPAPLSAPPVIVGSWNEEFEGHAVFPARNNPAMVPAGLGGFEWLMALKEVFGWNHDALASRRPFA